MPVDDQYELTSLGQVWAAVAALRAAAESIDRGMAVDRRGWRYVPDAYRLLGQVSELTGLLPDMLQQIVGSVSQELKLNMMAMDTGSADQGRSDAAIRAMSDNLHDAVDAAGQLHNAAAAAAEALSWAAYGGRPTDLAQAVPPVEV